MVCEHSPVFAKDCKPNKSLRTTVKVFLRTEEKKRESLRLKEAKNTPPVTPIEPTTRIELPTPAPEAATTEPTSKDQIDEKAEGHPYLVPNGQPSVTAEDREQVQQAEQDVPQPSIEV